MRFKDILGVHMCVIAQFEAGDIDDEKGASICLCFVWRCNEWSKEGNTLRMQIAAIRNSKKKQDAKTEV